MCFVWLVLRTVRDREMLCSGLLLDVYRGDNWVGAVKCLKTFCVDSVAQYTNHRGLQ